jgi:hypothetical protein
MTNGNRFSHVVTVSSVPSNTDEKRDKNARVDSVVRALAEFTPTPFRVTQRAYDDKKKLIRIEFGINVQSDYEAQLEAVRLVDALGPVLANAQYRPTIWALENPATAT